VPGKKGIYTSEHFPGYIWVNYQNRRGVLYENNTDSNPFGSHNFVLYKAEKFDLIDSGTRFVSASGERTKAGSWPDNGGGVGGLYDDLGDYTWVVLQDKETGLRSIYASIHTYNGWKELGYQVKKGQHAIATFPIWKYSGKKDEETGEEVGGKCYQRKAFWFTADQVERIA
jgi:hypothetical protein